jgi:HK97 family phage major capsid protein
MNWKEILKNSVQEQKKLLNKAKEEKRAFTDEEIASLDELDKKIKNAQNMINIEAKVKENELILPKEPEKNPVSNQIPSGSDVRVTGNPPKWENFGEELKAIKNYAVTGVMDDKFQNASGANETIPSEGGFLVGETTSNKLLQRSYDNSEVLKRCDKVTITQGDRLTIPYIDETSRATGSRMGGIRAYWINEGGTLTASKPKFGKFVNELEKLGALMHTTSEMLEDAPLMSQMVNKWFSDEFSFVMQDSVIRGNGGGQFTGLLNSLSTVTVAKQTNQAADTIVYENIVDMHSRLFAPLRNGAVWLINQEIEPELQTMAQVVGTGGVPVYLPANGISGKPYSTLMGYPILPIEQCSALGDKGDIFFGNLKSFNIVEKGGLKGASSIHVKFNTDEESFRWIYRVNGKSYWQNKLTPYKGAKTLGPVVTLAAR